MIGMYFWGLTLTKISRFIKSLLDRLVAAIALIAISPVALVVGIVVFFRMGRPVVFTQYLSGRDANIFQVYKFRSMTDARDSKFR
ncbi:MAG: sugar transferase [Heteroscytonema crispum UTEX LB 1556]